MTKKKKKLSKNKSSSYIPATKTAGQMNLLNANAFWWSSAILLLWCFVVYYPSLDNGFTNWDDEVYVHENQMIHKLNGDNLQKIFNWENPVSSNYHPITVASLAVNYHFSGLNPSSYHWTNLIFHLLNTFLVFYFVFYLSRQNLIVAWIAAFIFGLHPMHVESVAWISERKDVLYAFFFLLSMISYLRYVRQMKANYLYAALFLFVLACLSKAMAVVLAPILLLLDYWENRAFTQKSILEKVPFFIVALVFGLLAVKVQSEGGAVATYDTFSTFQRFNFAGYGFVMYIYKFFFPLQVSTFYPYPNLTASGNLPSIFYVTPILSIIILAASVYSKKYTKVIFWGIGFYLLTVVLVLQFMSVGQVVMADRYTYLPYLGLAFILAMGFHTLWHNKQASDTLRYAAAGGLVLYFGLLSYQTREACKIWKNSETLWTNVIEQFPYTDYAKVFRAYQNRGNYYGKNGRIEESLSDLNIAVQLEPNESKTYESLGNAYGSQNQLEKALSFYQKAIALDPSKASLYFNRAVVFSQQKRFNEAFRDYQKAIDLGQDLYTVLPNRAFAQMEAGQFAAALADYNSLIQAQPNNARFYLFRGKVYFKQANYPAAIQDFQIYVNANPNDGEGNFNLSLSYFQSNNLPQAQAYARKALQAGFPLSQGYRQQLGI
ncbi:MAG: tetratricopeptide repeat protein [Saprospiraceae bacterium]